MIIILLHVSVRPENRLEFEQTVMALRNDFRKEALCLSYDIFREVEQQDLYCLKGEFEKQEAIKEHFESENFSVLQGALKNLCTPPEMKLQVSTVLNTSDQPAAFSEIPRNLKALENK